MIQVRKDLGGFRWGEVVCRWSIHVVTHTEASVSLFVPIFYVLHLLDIGFWQRGHQSPWAYKPKTTSLPTEHCLVVSVKSSWPGSAVWHCKQQLPLWRCQCPSFIITSVVWSRMGYHLHRLDLAVCVILNGSLRDFSNFILLLGLIPRLW